MPSTLCRYRVFIASPGGLSTLRETFKATIEEYNRLESIPRGVLFDPVGWEETFPGQGRPQELINEDLRSCDFAIFLFRDRWGSPSDVRQKFTSGCEEEWKIATTQCRAGRMLDLQLFFLPVAEAQLKDPGSQLQKVLAFKSKIESAKNHLFKQLGKDDEFAAALRASLGRWLHLHEKGGEPPRILDIPMASVEAGIRTIGVPEEPHPVRSTSDVTQQLLGRASAQAELCRWESAILLAETAVALAKSQEDQFLSLSNQGFFTGEAGQAAAAIQIYDDLLKRMSQEAEGDEFAKIEAEVLFNKGALYGRMKNFASEQGTYDHLLFRHGSSMDPNVMLYRAKALSNKGVSYAKTNEPSKEIKAYDDLIEQFQNTKDSRLRVQVAKAMNNKGIALGELRRPDEQVLLCDSIEQTFGEDAFFPLRETVSRAMRNKAIILAHCGRRSEAIQAYEHLLRKYSSAVELSIQEVVARASVNRAVLLGEEGRHLDELAAYDKLIKKFGESTADTLQEQVAMALNNKGYRFGQSELRLDELKAYDEVIFRFGSSSAIVLQEQVAVALFNKAFCLGRLSRVTEALAAYDDLILRFSNATELPLREQTAMTMRNKGILLGLQGRCDDELIVYDQMLARFGAATEAPLREQVAKVLSAKAFRLGNQLRFQEEVIVCNDLIARFGGAPEQSLQPFVRDAMEARLAALQRLGRKSEAAVARVEFRMRFPQDIKQTRKARSTKLPTVD